MQAISTDSWFDGPRVPRGKLLNNEEHLTDLLQSRLHFINDFILILINSDFTEGGW